MTDSEEDSRGDPDDPICGAQAARWISMLVVPRQFRDSVWGDLEEDYAVRFPHAMPNGHARQWFLRQLLASAPRFVVCRLRTEVAFATWCTLLTSTAMGLAFAYVDSRPTWDDTGVLAFGILVTAGVLALIGAGRPWLLAMAVGSWIPLHNFAVHGGYTSLMALVFGFVGAYLGAAVRRVFACSGRSPRTPVSAHDAF